MSLLPCPHCGPIDSEPFLLEVDDEDCPLEAAIQCAQCYLTGPRMYAEEGEPGSLYEESTQRALFAAADAAWNALPRRPA